MSWHWRVRIYDKAGFYYHGQIKTNNDLNEINLIQDFYKSLTGCKMFLQGMSDQPFENTGSIEEAFKGVWWYVES